MEEKKTAIGSKIRGIREQKNIALEDMAKMSGLNEQYLGAIEADQQLDLYKFPYDCVMLSFV